MRRTDGRTDGRTEAEDGKKVDASAAAAAARKSEATEASGSCWLEEPSGGGTEDRASIIEAERWKERSAERPMLQASASKMKKGR